MSRVKIFKHEDVGINSIRDLTKEELISCIENVLEMNSSAKFWFERRVLDVADKRREKKLRDDEAKGDKWVRLEREYADLLAPYRGKKIGELPADVIKKGAELEREIKKAYEEYTATFG